MRTGTLKLRILKWFLIILAILLVLAAAVTVYIRINSLDLALRDGGYSHVIEIDDGIDYYSGDDYCEHHWKVIWAEKDGEKHMAIMRQGRWGFWQPPEPASALSGQYEGCEFLSVGSFPTYYSYGYDPYAYADSTKYTNNSEYEFRSISRIDWYFSGMNAVKTIDVPLDAIPRDSTLQIYQRGPEYVLHLSTYSKWGNSANRFGENGNKDPAVSSYEPIYQALAENGCVE